MAKAVPGTDLGKIGKFSNCCGINPYAYHCAIGGGLYTDRGPAALARRNDDSAIHEEEHIAY